MCCAIPYPHFGESRGRGGLRPCLIFYFLLCVADPRNPRHPISFSKGFAFSKTPSLTLVGPSSGSGRFCCHHVWTLPHVASEK